MCSFLHQSQKKRKVQFTQKWGLYIFWSSNFISFNVQILRKDHKTLNNIPIYLKFLRMLHQTKSGSYFQIFCGLLRILELFVSGLIKIFNFHINHSSPAGLLDTDFFTRLIKINNILFFHFR